MDEPMPSLEDSPSSRLAAGCGVIHVIGRSSELTDFLFDGLDGIEEAKVISYRVRSRRPWSSLLKSMDAYVLPARCRSLYFDFQFVARLQAIRPNDRVLFFAVENDRELRILRKYIRARQLALWLWNPISSFQPHASGRNQYLRWLRRAGIRAYTFDNGDARDFGIEATSQVFRHVPLATGASGISARLDVYFVGSDKGRLADLRILENEFQKEGLSTNFHVIGDRHRRYCAEERSWLRPEPLSYRENLDRIMHSRAVLEILQSGQRGVSLRYMEAMFLDRKLITNNPAACKMPGYDPSRIFILGNDELSGIRQFIEQPSKPVDPQVLRQHDIGGWLRQFFLA